VCGAGHAAEGTILEIDSLLVLALADDQRGSAKGAVVT
jgi:hypothetical protein